MRFLIAFNNIKLNKKKETILKLLKYVLFIIINCHIYVNHIRFCSFYYKERIENILLYTTNQFDS